MIILPAPKLRQVVRPAVLDDETHARLENGERIPLDRVDGRFRVFAAWDQVDRYAKDGVGEYLVWGEEPIRWRHRRRGDSHRRHGDVVIVKLPYPHGDGFFSGLVVWADWLERCGTTPGWSLGGSSMRLLRSTLRAELVTTFGELPAPRWTLGGRQQCWVEPGTTISSALQLDLPAAYTTVIGGLRYGGPWRRLERPALADLERLDRAGVPVLAHGRVRLPELAVGPLPERPKARPEPGMEWLEPSVPYPVAGSFTGLWTWAELEQAMAAGARFRCDQAWVEARGGSDDVEAGLNGPYPFAAWLEAVLEGRREPGFAGLLAKATGNALWGQFIVDDRKSLAVQRFDRGKPTVLPVRASHGHQVRAWDLGELVCGRVRARLYELLGAFSERVVCCHTDGGWLRGPLGPVELEALPGNWRVKTEAGSLDVLDQQKLRWRTTKGHRGIVLSGVPAGQAERTFERLWASYKARRAA